MFIVGPGSSQGSTRSQNVKTFRWQRKLLLDVCLLATPETTGLVNKVIYVATFDSPEQSER